MILTPDDAVTTLIMPMTRIVKLIIIIIHYHELFINRSGICAGRVRGDAERLRLRGGRRRHAEDAHHYLPRHRHESKVRARPTEQGP